jgi:hypothetical protein
MRASIKIGEKWEKAALYASFPREKLRDLAVMMAKYKTPIMKVDHVCDDRRWRKWNTHERLVCTVWCVVLLSRLQDPIYKPHRARLIELVERLKCQVSRDVARAPIFTRAA